MKPSELTKDLYLKKVKDVLIEVYKYSSEEADDMMRRFSKDVDEGYRSLTSEEKFVSIHPNDSESLRLFRNGNYIESGISDMAWGLDLMA